MKLYHLFWEYVIAKRSEQVMDIRNQGVWEILEETLIYEKP